MSFPFHTVMDADKEIIGKPLWTEPKTTSPDKKIRVVAPLAIGGRVFQGLELIGRAYANLRNANMSFSLVYLPTDNRREAVTMARVDWRPVSPHENDDHRAPPELIGITIMGSHHHSFVLNWSKFSERPLKWLPIAEEISPDFQTVNELIDGVGKFFRISNAGSALGSPWPEDLFAR